MNWDKFFFVISKEFLHFFPKKNYINICINFRKNLNIHQNFLFQEKKFSFNENRTKIQSVETKEKIWDCFINELGQIFFCNFKGIFTFLPEKKLHKYLYKFQKKSEIFTKTFYFKRKKCLFVLKLIKNI